MVVIEQQIENPNADTDCNEVLRIMKFHAILSIYQEESYSQTPFLDQNRKVQMFQKLLCVGIETNDAECTLSSGTAINQTSPSR